MSKKTYTQNQDDKQHGGKREGAGRPDEGKERFNVSLTAENVRKAKARTANFSALLDTLLAGWLKKTTPAAPKGDSGRDS